MGKNKHEQYSVKYCMIHIRYTCRYLERAVDFIKKTFFQ